MEIVKDTIYNKIAEIVGITPTEIRSYDTLANLNIDSIQAAELESHVTEILKVEADRAVFDAADIGDYLSKTLQKTIAGKPITVDIVRDIVQNKIAEINGCEPGFDEEETLANCNIDSIQASELEFFVCDAIKVGADRTVFEAKNIGDYINKTHQKTLNK